MKNAKKFIAIILAAMMLLTLASCNASPDKENYGGATNSDASNGGYNGVGNMSPDGNFVTEDSKPSYDIIYGSDDMESSSEEVETPSMEPSDSMLEPSPIIQILENDFTKTAEQAISTFSADVDTASYTYLRKLTSLGYKFDQFKATAGRSIRTEELVNYFSYNYASPKSDELLGKNVTISKSPWNADTMLLTIGLKAPEAQTDVSNNLVFLIDVSGSMKSDDKLELLKKAFSYLTENLDANDRVSIVTYAGNERVVLDGCEGYRKVDILNAINNLAAGGSTNGEAGIVKAYELAEKHFIAGGNNRIIMASDGDLNVGIRSPEELTNLVSEKRDSGVFLSILGFGTGNFRDDNMSALAQNGNGVYHYIDCEAEAERIFTEKLLSSIRTVAKDVKLQITFNPDTVAEYRLIGYENRLLNTEDFADDTKDAGDMGSGHTVTVCYEIKLTDNTSASDLATIAIRYKQPDGIKSELEEYNVTRAHITSTPTDEQQFVATVVEFSMLLRGSKFANKETTTLENLIARLEALDLDNEKAELLGIMKKLS